VGRRFSGSEILLEVRAQDDQRVWVEAGDQVRRLSEGDQVHLRLREVETVAFPPGSRGPGDAVFGRGAPEAPSRAEVAPAAVEPPIH
jgi:hypothetical protein